jgi:ribosomal protein L28
MRSCRPARAHAAHDRRSKRLFKPNVKTAFLYSEALQQKLKLQVTTSVLK